MADTMISPLDAPLLDSGRLAIEGLISRRCRFQGFLNQSRLPEFYCLIDLLILPSIQGEVWGGVVNEALGLALSARPVANPKDLVNAVWKFRPVGGAE